MCGIAGYVSTESDPSAGKALVRRMCQTLRHRGPDDEGYFVTPQVGLGMRRLSIIDLAGGRQPVSNEDQTISIVFNGELYNYREMRAELMRRGHTFVTHSDTEVIVHAYEEYGDGCLEYFNGMYAFALWDAPQQRLLIARDRLGIKPLYYWQHGSTLVFGSELKALLAHPEVPTTVDLIALDQFLALEYIPAPRTIYESVYKLPPGHKLVFAQGELRIERYWQIPALALPGDAGACVEALRELVDDAVRMQMVSDVPIGAFLSGGIDSSTVVAAMCEASPQVRTFAIGFDDTTYDELDDARAVAAHFGTQHEERVLAPDIAGLAERLVSHFDEPFADFSLFPTYLVSEVARESVKVVLTGDGGDELFGGYDTYVAQQMDRYYRLLPELLRTQVLPGLLARVPPQPAKKGLVNKMKRFVEGAALPRDLQHTRWMIFMSDAERQALYAPAVARAQSGCAAAPLLRGYFHEFAHAQPLAQQQYVDVKTYLVDDILTKVDRMSMAASLEARVPLLDHRIVEFALNLPATMKLQGGQTKVILRKAMAARLPSPVLGKPKQGFSIPLKHWLGSTLRPLMLDLLAPEQVRQRGYFMPDTVSGWVNEHLEGRANHSHRLWALMVFELWHRQVHDTHGRVPRHDEVEQTYA